MPQMCARHLPTLTVTLLAAVLMWSAALAQGTATPPRWPERPIRLVVPFQAGSSSDTIARIVSQKLAERLGQQIVVENKVGAASVLGTEAVARAEPDGYTLGLANTTTHAATAALGGALPFDPIKDFAPVAMIADSPFVLLVTPGLAAHSVPELIAAAKAKPGALNYASAGIGSMAHLSGALFANLAGVNITHVPYRGTSQSMIDVMEGRIEILFGTIAPSLPHIRAGKLRALATTGETRNSMLPELPTMAEAGLAGYESGLWTAFVYPAGVSPAIVAQLNAETNAVIRDPDVVAALQKQGVDVAAGGPDVLAARIKSDLAKWHDVVAKAGIKAK